MQHDEPRRPAPRAERRAWGVAAVLTAVAVVLLAQGLQGWAVPPASVERPPATAVTRGVPLRVLDVERAPLPTVRPAALRIPSIGVDTALIDLGLHPDQTVEVPRDADLAGWFDRGPIPGQHGSAVILGHVDSVAGPAVFHRLRELAAGDLVEVRLSDGSLTTFRVARVATFVNEEFPAREVYAGSPGRATLNLVTCGGEYDAARGGYQSNVVVFAESMDATSASSGRLVR